MNKIIIESNDKSYLIYLDEIMLIGEIYNIEYETFPPDYYFTIETKSHNINIGNHDKKKLEYIREKLIIKFKEYINIDQIEVIK